MDQQGRHLADEDDEVKKKVNKIPRNKQILLKTFTTLDVYTDINTDSQKCDIFVEIRGKKNSTDYLFIA